MVQYIHLKIPPLVDENVPKTPIETKHGKLWVYEGDNKLTKIIGFYDGESISDRLPIASRGSEYMFLYMGIRVVPEHLQDEISELLISLGYEKPFYFHKELDSNILMRKHLRRKRPRRI